MNEFEKVSIETREALKSLHKLFPANPSPEDSPWGFLEGLRLDILDLQTQIQCYEEKLGPKVKAALEQLKKDFPEIKYSAEDPIDYLLRLQTHLRLQVMDHAAKYQEIIGEIAKIGPKIEQEKQELKDKIQALEWTRRSDQKAWEGDGWKEKARKRYLFGDCPTCFRPRGEGHEEHCHFGQFFRNNQELLEEVVSLREKINKINQLDNRWNDQTKAIEDLTKALSDSQDKQQHLEKRCIEFRKVAESYRDINIESMEEASELRSQLLFYKGPFNLSTPVYLVVKGEGRGFEIQCSKAMANGWRLQGGISVKSNGELNQAFVR